ncbi:MAG: hypothetical protein QXM16_06880 [Nitrososphaerota archaeon]
MLWGAWGLSTVAEPFSDTMGVFGRGLWMDAGDKKKENEVSGDNP